eukprot:1512749-Rhodomonas_salina.2
MACALEGVMQESWSWVCGEGGADGGGAVLSWRKASSAKPSTGSRYQHPRYLPTRPLCDVRY